MEKLRGKRLIMRKDQGRPAELLDNFGHGEGFAGAGHTQQHLMFFAALHAAHQFSNGLGLITLRFVVAGKPESMRVHGHRTRQP